MNSEERNHSQDTPKAERYLDIMQLWIYGPTNMGKTRFKEQLVEKLRVYELAYDGNWFDEYEDGMYDLIVADEFKGQLKPTVMNRLLGSEMTSLCRRGTVPVRKLDRLPMIVLSNYNIRDCYHKLALMGAESLVAMERRVNQVQVRDSQIDIVFRQVTPRS